MFNISLFEGEGWAGSFVEVHVDSLVVARRLSYPMAFEVLVSLLGIEPKSPALGGNLIPGITRKSLNFNISDPASQSHDGG